MERRQRWILLLLTAAFALRGLLLILVLPIGDPLDEPFHFAYAEYIAATGRIPRESDMSMPVEVLRFTALLPRSTSFGGLRLIWKEYLSMPRDQQRLLRRDALTARPGDRGRFWATNYETQQPPAMYCLAALPIRALATAPANIRLFAARSIALAAAALAVPLAYVFFRKLLPKASALGATLAFVAFPGLGTFTSRFTNDALALPIAAALLALLPDAAQGRLTRRRGIALALLLAAGAWTKLYFLAFLPAAPLAALLSPRDRRSAVFRRAVAASVVGFLLIVPWLARQHADTGDWLGLTETKTVTRSGIGLGPRIAAVPSLFRAGPIRAFGATFLYPGTWAAMGAPRPAVRIAALAMATILILAQIRIGSASRRRRRAWAGAAVALACFAFAQLAHDASLAAISKDHGGAGGDGWYFLILLPVVLAAGSASGKSAGPRMFAAAAALFVMSEWICTFGRLAATYAGRIDGWDPPFSSYRHFLFSPRTCFGVFSRVGLIEVPGPALAAIAAAWLLALLAAAFLVLRSGRPYLSFASSSPNPASTSSRPASRSGAR